MIKKSFNLKSGHYGGDRGCRGFKSGSYSPPFRLFFIITQRVISTIINCRHKNIPVVFFDLYCPSTGAVGVEQGAYQSR